jgi:hypothetical protein
MCGCRYRYAAAIDPRNTAWRSTAVPVPPPRTLGVSASLPALLADADLRNGTPLSRLPNGLTMALSHAGPPKPPQPPKPASTALAGAVQQRATQWRINRRMEGLAQRAPPFPLTERVTRSLSSNSFARRDRKVLHPCTALDQVPLDRRHPRAW